MPSNEEPQDYNRPVAYDVDGNPLYAHPAQPDRGEETMEVTDPTTPQAPSPQIVHAVRPHEMPETIVSDEVKAKHDDSVKRYPGLNLSAGEYVLEEVRRYAIGLILPFITGAILIALSISVLFNYDLVVKTFNLTGDAASVSAAYLPVLLFMILIAIVLYLVYYTYNNNKFYLTNESVIQEIQIGLFYHREQTISLGDVEDSSYLQSSLVQEIFGYGTIRLSTIGDEDTYTFNYTYKPKERIVALNDAVESFKNGRPVDPMRN